jgi:hypothetical protein
MIFKKAPKPVEDILAEHELSDVIQAHKEATTKAAKEIKKAGKYVDNVFKENHFTIKIFSGVIEKPTGGASQ